MAAQRDKEPSMEEILASIRRIITDEEAPPPSGTIAVPEPQPHAPEDEHFMAPPADILELTGHCPSRSAVRRWCRTRPSRWRRSRFRHCRR
jgi:hypothetical protein